MRPPIPETDSARLSSDEVDALLTWLAASGRLGERGDGAVTVEAIAEAYGVEPDEVAAHLRRLRAERAFSQPAPKAKDQRGLLALALTMLVVAGAVYKLTPHKLTMDEMDDKLREIRSRPHPVHYPVVKMVDLGQDSPPTSYPLELDGRYTIVGAKPMQGKLLPIRETEAQLCRSLEALATAAEMLDHSTPAPPAGTKLPPAGMVIAGTEQFHVRRYYGQMGMDGMPEGRMVNGRWVTDPPKPLAPGEYLVQGIGLPLEDSPQPATTVSEGGRRMIIRSEPGFGLGGPRLTAPPSDVGALAEWRAALARRVAYAVEADHKQQEAAYQPSATPSPLPDQWISTPPGFSIRFEGRINTSYGGPQAVVIPLQVQPTVDQMEKAVRFALKKDAQGQDNSMFPRSFRTQQEKQPIATFATFTISSPQANLVVKVPIERSKQFPTAADVIQGQEATIVELRAKIRQMVLDVNEGKEPVK
jgi:hypothetical protein